MTDSLKDINLKNVYNSKPGTRYLIDSFLMPCLNVAVEYDRITGFFSSQLFPLIFNGIKKIVSKSGKIRLIIGVIPRGDLDILSKSREEIEYELLKELKDKILASDTIPEKDHLKLLGWLIIKDILEIKLGIILNKSGLIANIEEIKQFTFDGILHKKVGIISDEEGNFITFSGSINESLHGWLAHDEEFKVFKQWKYPEFAESDKANFLNYWNNRVDFIKTISLPNEILSEIKIFAPKSYNEINFHNIRKFYEKLLEHETKVNLEAHKQIITGIIPSNKWNSNGWRYSEDLKTLYIDEIIKKFLRTCQKEALSELRRNNYKGILEMATASGKTLAAIIAAYQLSSVQKKTLIIIGVPDQFLVDQWTKEIGEFTFNIISASSAYSNWKSGFRSTLRNLELDFQKYFFVVATSHAIENYIIDAINDSKINDDEILFIADEVHWTGQPEAINALIDFNPKFRIGLSATPYRKYDDEGSRFVLEWFNNVIYQFSIGQGQEQGYLNDYDYRILLCPLNQREEDDFKYLSRKLGALRQKIIKFPNKIEYKEKFIQISINRSQILKLTESKKEIFRTLIRKLKRSDNIKNIVVYCENKAQLQEYQRILLDEGIFRFKRFIGETNFDKRKEIIEDLNNNRINIVLAIKCLNQGIDIPKLETAIVVASSGVEREWIQRTGRLLRKSPNKKSYSTIYDFLSISLNPENKTKDPILSAQINRIKFFLEYSRNKKKEIEKLNLEGIYFNGRF